MIKFQHIKTTSAFSEKKFLKKSLTHILQKTIFVIVLSFAVFFILNILSPLRVNVEYSTLVTDKNGNVLKAFLTSDDKWRMMTELDEITPEMQKAIVFKEDKYFYYHPGINPFSILRATTNNIISRKRTSGASTITMQVARMLNPKKRTYVNKAVEIFRALQLDMLYSKKEILQLYLNLVPYGGNIEGVKAASVLYLQKTPSVLSLAELTALSIIPNRPTSLRPGINNNAIVTERNKWLKKFANAHLFSDDEIQTALNEQFTAFRTEGPDIAPHFCYRMQQQYPKQPIIKTTLDAEMQMKSEKIVSDYTKQLWGIDIHNAAVMILDNSTRNVLVYVGSSNFYGNEDGGQVDGVTAIRSPGSTLKPLVYALSFDKGLATPQTIISDVPINFSGYSPKNYDEKFRGNISVENALAQSLNVPAVKILDKLGSDIFINTLITANFKTIEQQKEYLGLSAVLGGCGVTLEQLTNLYASFANAGKYKPLNFLLSDNSTDSTPIISDASSFMITEILTQHTRPDVPNLFQNSKNIPLIAWKTGTSYGRKDAWSIGYNDKYTIGVWCGNFSGKGVPELSGADVATPLLFQLFRAIDKQTDKNWNKMPANVDFRYVCSVSGKIPNDFCRNAIMDYYIPSVSSNSKCGHLLAVKVSADSSISYCTECAPAIGYKEKNYINYSPEIISWMEKENIPYEKIPVHNSACERVFAEGAPQITSPVNKLEYFINKTDKEKIMLASNVKNDVKKITWYINDKIYLTTDANTPVFFIPEEGKIKISCSDDKGRNTDIWIQVYYI